MNNPEPTAIVKREERFVANIYNPRIAVRLDDEGFAHQICEWVRLFADTDLFTVGKGSFDVWGSGVAKLCKALGARLTPLAASPDPVNGTLKPGLRCAYDEHSGRLLSVQQDILLECRHPKTGSPIHILATGEVDVWHAYLGEMAKLAGGREDVAAIVTDKGREKIEAGDEAGVWIFHPYSFGTWLALNVSKRGVQDAQSKLGEMGRQDKVRGFATSKAARLALKQSNLVPMRFNRSSFLTDGAGREYIDIPVVSWVVFDGREKMQAAIDAMLAGQARSMEAQWEAVADDEDPFETSDGEPERATMAGDALAIEQDDTIHEPAVPVERQREKVEAQPEPKPEQPAPSKRGVRTDAQRAMMNEIVEALGDDDGFLDDLLAGFGINSLIGASVETLTEIRAEVRATLGR